MTVKPYPDPRYPELRCEDPTAPGCATEDDHLRWFGHDLYHFITAHALQVNAVVISLCVIGLILFMIHLWDRAALRPEWTEDDIDNRPLGEIFPYLTKREDDE